MKVKAQVLTTAQVVALLYREFGPVREWSEVLHDHRKNKSPFKGVFLFPVGRQYDGQCKRPRYRVSDVTTFIRHVAHYCPKPIRSDFNPVEVEIDETLSRHGLWYFNKAA